MKEMIDKYGKIPSVFAPYDLIDLSHGICTTLTTANCGGYAARGGVLLKDSHTNGKDNKKEYKEYKMNYNLVNFCEFDKYAVKSYCAIHGVDERLNLGDITQIDIDKLPTNIDLITHGSPCQSFSISGKQHGGVKSSGTRSSLLWNSVEIIRHCKPKFVIWENVKNVLSKKHKPVFDAYVDEMKNMGYNTYYQVLNAKNYDIPQNRERIYAISVREDVDNNQNYTGHITHNKYYDRNDTSLFPKPFNNGLRLRDFLENEVEERYYIKQDKVDQFFINTPQIDTNKSAFSVSELCENEHNKIQMLGLLDIKGNEQIRRVYGSDGLSPTLNTMEGGNRQPKVLTPKDFRIRKLTPKECYRLMGFSDEDFERAKKVNSNSQLYKQAGNSIVVNVLEEIYKCLHDAYPNDFITGMNVISLFSGIGAFEKALERVDFEK